MLALLELTIDIHGFNSRHSILLHITATWIPGCLRDSRLLCWLCCDPILTVQDSHAVRVRCPYKHSLGFIADSAVIQVIIIVYV